MDLYINTKFIKAGIIKILKIENLLKAELFHPGWQRDVNPDKKIGLHW